MKKQLWQLFKSENETGKKFKSLFGINLKHIKKHLCHTVHQEMFKIIA